MSNHQCMMSYVQGANVGTTSTFVLERRESTPDRLAVCTVERIVTHRLPLAQGGEPQHNRTTGGRSRTTWTKPPEPQGPQGGGGESPTQHDAPAERRTASTTGEQQAQGPQRGKGRPYHAGGVGGGSNPGSYILLYTLSPKP